jgi:hypothetical protein
VRGVPVSAEGFTIIQYKKMVYLYVVWRYFFWKFGQLVRIDTNIGRIGSIRRFSFLNFNPAGIISMIRDWKTEGGSISTTVGFRF